MALTPISAVTDSWSSSGTTYRGLDLTVSDTGSGAASTYLRFVSNAAEKYAFGKDSAIRIDGINALAQTGGVTTVGDASVGITEIKGNVGIGTVIPTHDLEIETTKINSTLFKNVTPTAALVSRFHNSASDGLYLAVYGPTYAVGSIGNVGPGGAAVVNTGGALAIGTRDAGDVHLLSNDTIRMTMVSGGNVGIGTTTPASTLHVYNGASGGAAPGSLDIASIENNGSAYLNIITGTTNTGGIIFSDTSRARGNLAYLHTSDSMAFTTAGSEAMRIDSSGNVGIGTTSPGALMELKHASGAARLILNSGDLGVNDTNVIGEIDFHNSDASTDIAGVTASIKNVAEGTFANFANSAITFQTNYNVRPAVLVERMRISAGGNVGIGTTAPDSKLTVKDSFDNSATGAELYTGGLEVINTSAVVGSYSQLKLGNRGEDPATDGRFLKSITNANNNHSFALGAFAAGTETEHLRVLQNGNVGIGTTTPTAALQVVGDVHAGLSNTGTGCNFIGSGAGESNSGINSSGFGYQSLYQNTGLGNTASGYQSLYQNTGIFNTASGYRPLYQNTGSFNTATGYQPLYQNEGWSNTATGYQALYGNTGSNNTAIGYRAGYHQSGGNVALRTASTSTFIGSTTRGVNVSTLTGTTGAFNALINNASVNIGDTTINLDDTVLTGVIYQGNTFTVAGDSQVYRVTGDKTAAANVITALPFEPSAKVAWADDAILTVASSAANQLVLGYAAQSIGANTAVIGNDSIIITALKGNVGIGTTTPNDNALLDITSTTKAFMPPRMTTTQKNAVASPTAGMVVYDSTLNKLAVYTGAGWEEITST